MINDFVSLTVSVLFVSESILVLLGYLIKRS